MKKKLLLLLIGILTIGLFKQISDKVLTAPLIDVVLENQNDLPVLGNGCEITALSMLLNYHGYAVNKNELADILDYVPLKIDENTHGNPKDGFVGDITGGFNAMGVGVEPISLVAEKKISKKQNLFFGRNIPFEIVENQVYSGNPVWVTTTIDYQPPTSEDLLVWQTTSDKITVNRLCHAVVVTGITKEAVWVNDPYGFKNRKIERARFEAAYDSMEQQALYLY